IKYDSEIIKLFLENQDKDNPHRQGGAFSLISLDTSNYPELFIHAIAGYGKDFQYIPKNFFKIKLNQNQVNTYRNYHGQNLIEEINGEYYFSKKEVLLLAAKTYGKVLRYIDREDPHHERISWKDIKPEDYLEILAKGIEQFIQAADFLPVDADISNEDEQYIYNLREIFHKHMEDFGLNKAHNLLKHLQLQMMDLANRPLMINQYNDIKKQYLEIKKQFLAIVNLVREEVVITNNLELPLNIDFDNSERNEMLRNILLDHISAISSDINERDPASNSTQLEIIYNIAKDFLRIGLPNMLKNGYVKYGDLKNGFFQIIEHFKKNLLPEAHLYNFKYSNFFAYIDYLKNNPSEFDKVLEIIFFASNNLEKYGKYFNCGRDEMFDLCMDKNKDDILLRASYAHYNISGISTKIYKKASALKDTDILLHGTTIEAFLKMANSRGINSEKRLTSIVHIKPENITSALIDDWENKNSIKDHYGQSDPISMAAKHINHEGVVIIVETTPIKELKEAGINVFVAHPKARIYQVTSKQNHGIAIPKTEFKNFHFYRVDGKKRNLLATLDEFAEAINFAKSLQESESSLLVKLNTLNNSFQINSFLNNLEEKEFISLIHNVAKNRSNAHSLENIVDLFCKNKQSYNLVDITEKLIERSFIQAHPDNNDFTEKLIQRSSAYNFIKAIIAYYKDDKAAQVELLHDLCKKFAEKTSMFLDLFESEILELLLIKKFKGYSQLPSYITKALEKVDPNYLISRFLNPNAKAVEIYKGNIKTSAEATLSSDEQRKIFEIIRNKLNKTNTDPLEFNFLKNIANKIPDFPTRNLLLEITTSLLERAKSDPVKYTVAYRSNLSDKDVIIAENFQKTTEHIKYLHNSSAPKIKEINIVSKETGKNIQIHIEYPFGYKDSKYYPVVMMPSPFGHKKEDLDLIAESYLNKGYIVIRFDYSFINEKGIIDKDNFNLVTTEVSQVAQHIFMDKILQEDQAILTTLRNNVENQGLEFMGISMGSVLSLKAAHELV
ncbi:MAG: hypothetical protein KKA19_00400, partial [Candidatus Margulisbacteria bacterium]|nr:hypothetical protein [Candidatus Margulisiibacteriota bacterium]